MQTQKPTSVSPHIKTCPQCGGDRFRVAKTWQGIESFEQHAPNGFRVRKVDADEEIYHEIQCDNCGREVADVDDLFLQPPPAA